MNYFIADRYTRADGRVLETKVSTVDIGPAGGFDHVIKSQYSNRVIHTETVRTGNNDFDILSGLQAAITTARAKFDAE